MSDTRKLDCSGMVCPVPVARTKRTMQEMKSGDVLEVYGDFCEAGENIKRFVENNGGRILESKIEGNYYFIKFKKL